MFTLSSMENLKVDCKSATIREHVYVTPFKRKNDVTPPNAMNDVSLQ